jgi:6-pyruvoyltetrahydropterin/6-carboxytetrahydropterin synthase
VKLESDELVSTGFVIDFGVIKKFVKGWIDEKWDHTLILYEEDPLLNLLKAETSTYSFEVEPTAENMAEWLWGVVEEFLLKHKHVRLQSVSIRETATSIATYRGGV